MYPLTAEAPPPDIVATWLARTLARARRGRPAVDLFEGAAGHPRDTGSPSTPAETPAASPATSPATSPAPPPAPSAATPAAPPAAPPAAGSDGHRLPAATPPQERHVLYIEDNAVNALIVREMLATLPGYRLSVAPDGTSGLAMALDLQPDLVLLDMHLPDMDGFAVLKGLRAQARTAHLTVVALSANVLPDHISRAMAAGLADYWTKPLDMALFVRRMQQLLPPAG